MIDVLWFKDIWVVRFFKWIFRGGGIVNIERLVFFLNLMWVEYNVGVIELFERVNWVCCIGILFFLWGFGIRNFVGNLIFRDKNLFYFLL